MIIELVIRENDGRLIARAETHSFESLQEHIGTLERYSKAINELE